MYDEYRRLFMDQVINNTTMETAFKSLSRTDIYERYMLNVAQFSAAKNASECRLLQDAVFDGKRMRSFKEFEREADTITPITQRTWLRTEYESCRRQAMSASKFSDMQRDADLYPYWVYKGRMDSRERDEHRAMEDLVFRIGSPEGDKCFPPIDWNCRCHGDPVDGRYLDENNLKVASDEEVQAALDSSVGDNFKYNAAVQGPMPNDHSYFDLFGSANSGNSDYFGMDSEGDAQIIGFARGVGLHYAMEIAQEWRRQFPHDRMDNLIIQNKQTMANVLVDTKAIHHVAKHYRGMANLPNAIQHPTEIWSRWEDAAAQRVVLRDYILLGKISYIVQTRDGMVTDAFAVSGRQANKYRTGVILN